MRRAAAVWALVAVWAPALAQTPDSTATPPDTTVVVADTTAGVLAAPADSLAPPPPPALVFGDVAGLVVTPVPAVTAALDPARLLGDAPTGLGPAAFSYDLGAPGRSGGVALDALDPDTPALTLDGRAVQDLVTGAPRLDLVPLAVAGPVRWGDGAQGRPGALATGLRDFRLSVPVTELRYLGGQNGLRHASGTHAQTRRPPGFLRATEADRLTVTFHAANRAADGFFPGAQLRHTDALGRLLLTRPGLAVETGVLYADRTEGARLGVVAQTGLPPTAVFGPATATVTDPSATRRTLRTEGWARARIALVAAPTEVGVSVEEQRLIYVVPPDTARAESRRWSAFVEQPAGLGAHRLRLRLDASYDPAPRGNALTVDGRLGLHGTLADSVALGRAALVLSAGASAVGDAVWPSASARVGLGPASVGVRLGGRAPSQLERAAFGSAGALPPGPVQTTAADAALALTGGDWRLGLRAFASATRDGIWLVGREGGAVEVVTERTTVSRGGVAVGVGWRERARRGLYLGAEGVAQAVAGTGEVVSRLDDALPRLRAHARIGVRAQDVGDGVLDLDLAAVGRGWTTFRSRRVDPGTGALVLPDPTGTLGIAIPPRATLGLEATATFSARASLFLRYDNALAERVYAGALVTQGEPLPAHVLRFGVFWALLN